jgi:hypothetical protein
VGVEPTTLAAKASVNGFEGHEDHRTLFASSELHDALGCAPADEVEESKLYVELSLFSVWSAGTYCFGDPAANCLRAMSMSFASVQTS